MRILLFGAGYVGCVSAACLAQLGHEIVVVDPNTTKIDALNSGQSPILETDLELMIAAAVRAHRLHGVDRVDEHAMTADVAVVCVPTPSGSGGGTDITALRTVLKALMMASIRRANSLPIAIRSTIRSTVLRTLAEEVSVPADRLPLVINPEFLRETTAIKDFFRPPFLIAGGDDTRAVEQVLSLYDGIDSERFQTTMETAGLVKYASNAFHALKIAFANEVATLSDLEGADPLLVMDLIRKDTLLNVSPAYLRPGFAFGGSCLPKDLRAVVAHGAAFHEPLPLLAAVLSSNQRRIDQAAALIMARPPRRLGFLGLSFKAGTDDLRESPYVELAERLLGKGFELRIYDPDLDPAKLMGANKAYIDVHLPHLGRLLVATVNEALEGAEGVILCKGVLSKESLRVVIESGVELYDLEYHTRRLLTAAVPSVNEIGPLFRPARASVS